jgi:hypothetical protein
MCYLLGHFFVLTYFVAEGGMIWAWGMSGWGGEAGDTTEILLAGSLQEAH